jgi:predicted acylesterase/phospholipase RssA
MSVWKPDAVILGPGGIKGLLEIGCLEILEASNILTDVNHYVGVSVGAVIAFLRCIGYKFSEISKKALETNIFRFPTIPTGNNLQELIEHIKVVMGQLKTQKGILGIGDIRDFLVTLIVEKLGCIPSLNGLYMASGKKLTCVTLNISQDSVEYISHVNHPEMNCIDAVLRSINIPGVFEGVTDHIDGSQYVDGALGDPCPIKHIDDGETRILNLYIDELHRNTAMIEYLYASYSAPMRQLRKLAIEGASKHCRHIRLVCDVSVFSLFLATEEDKKKLIRDGHSAGQNFVGGVLK